MSIFILFQDRYAHAQAIPSIDEQQDYELTGFQENGGKTLLKFKRKFDTCDPWDRKLEVRIRTHSYWDNSDYCYFGSVITEYTEYQFPRSSGGSSGWGGGDRGGSCGAPVPYPTFKTNSKQSSLPSTISGRMNRRKYSVHSRKRE